MAARKRASTTDERVELARLPAPPPPAVDEPIYLVPPLPSAAEARAERELDDILGEIGGGDVRVKVSRFSESGAMQSCGEMAGDSFSMEALTDTFGGGKYLLRFFNGKTELARTRAEVDSLIPARNPRAPKIVPGAVQPAQSIGDMAAVMTTMMTMMMNNMQISQQGNAAMMTVMVEMMKARPQENPMDMAIRMAELMKGGAGAGGGSVAEYFAIFEKGMNVARKLEGGSDDSVMPMIAEGVKGVTAIMEGIGAEKRANAAAMEARRVLAPPVVPPVALPSASPAAATEPPAPLAPSETFMSNARPWLAAALPFKAQLNAMIGFFPPTLAADALLERLGDDELDDLVADIEDGAAPGFVRRTLDVLGVAGTAYTDTAVQWLTDVAVAIIESTNPDAEADAPGLPTEEPAL